MIGDFGEKYNLNLEQIGVIYDLVNQILTGEMNAGGFTEKLKKTVKEEDWDLGNEKIDSIVRDLNEKIFVPIREAMQKTSPKTVDDVAPTREEVLHGIENPVNTPERGATNKINTIPVPKPIIPKPISVPTPTPTITQIPIPEAPTLQKPTAIEVLPNMNIMEAKLATAVKMPVTEVKVTVKPPAINPVPVPKPPQANIPKTYATDPYREPPTA